MTKYSIDKKRI